MPSTLGQMVLDVAERHNTVALQFPRDGHAAFISYPELGSISSEIARGLISLGIATGDRVAILGLTSAEWTLSDYGALCAGAVVTPIYHTNSPEECEYVLAHSEAKLVFCEDAAQAAKVAQVRDRCPSLEHVVVLDRSDRGGMMTLEELRSIGMETSPEHVQDRVACVAPDDIATLVYTSGTTGPPKACMLSHANVMYATHTYAQRLGFDHTHALYQFLPLAHVLARVAQNVALSVGARVIYWSGDASKIVDELEQTAPTHFPAVPRVYEKVHGEVTSKVAGSRREQRLLFRWALSVGARAQPKLRERHQPNLLTDLQFRLADRLVLSKVRALFGPSLQMGLVGAAPCAREMLEFFEACGVLVLEGYGMSETCAAATINTFDAVRLGTVGRPLPGSEVATAPDGEIMIRGPQVFKGYYKDPESTEQILTDDGWLHSGDLGAIDDDGFVSITGRKKEIIITSSGKNIAPVNIESQLRDSRFISEAVVFGDDRPYLVAMLTLDRDAAAQLAARVGIADDLVSIAHDPKVREQIQQEIDVANAKFARIEQVKRFGILDHELTQADGEMTPTLKVKRSAVYKKYAEFFDGLYAAAEGD
ncbi:MAG: AMP-dependent synthetase/ligase [Solirubrobacteraceae bacterium]